MNGRLLLCPFDDHSMLQGRGEGGDWGSWRVVETEVEPSRFLPEAYKRVHSALSSAGLWGWPLAKVQMGR